MRIGIDARPLQNETRYRGIGTALGFLLVAMKDQLGRDDSLVLYVDPDLTAPEILGHYPDARVLHVRTPAVYRKRFVRSVLSSRPIRAERADVDVLLQYDTGLGIPTAVPTVALFHDLIPYLFREQERMNRPPGVRRVKVALARRVYWRRYVRVLRSYERAHRIIALSHSSKRDFLAHVDSGRGSAITVVHLGVAHRTPATTEPTREITSITERPFLLYVGGIDFRKNITGMVRSFYELKPEFPDLQLVMVGKEFTLDAQLADLGWFTTLRENVEFARDVVTPGFVSHDDLLHLYRRAQVFVFPSRYEGFGLPVLEAMQLGCPVVAYANSSLPEVVGDAVPLVEDGGDLAPAIRRVLADPAHRERLIRDGIAQAATFTWERTAAETLEVLRSAVSCSGTDDTGSLPPGGGPP